MWIGADGRVHTVAAPDWRDVIAVSPSVELSRLPWLSEQIEKARANLFASGLASLAIPGGEEAALPPRPLVLPDHAFGGDIKAFQDAVAAIPVWWRLDVLDALEEASEGD